jgi:hypothetical protein
LMTNENTKKRESDLNADILADNRGTRHIVGFSNAKVLYA